MIDLRQAAELIQTGALVAFPTETVYGLGARADDDQAVARIFAAKGRPSFNPLIVHVQSPLQAWDVGSANETAVQLAASFWPGPLTLVLKRQPDCPVAALCSAGLNTVAVRMPAHPVAQALIEASGCAIAAPSANRSGKLSPTRAEHVMASFGQASPPILQGLPATVGLESTVVSCVDGVPVLLRQGGICQAAIETVLGRPISAQLSSDKPSAPGQLSAHYAPNSAIRLKASQLREGEVWLGFGPGCFDPGLNLSPSGDLVEAAANLFAFLHRLDADQPSSIAVAPVPEQGLGLAINDRLVRAAYTGG